MVVVKVPEAREEEMLKIFYDNSMFTFEGIELDKKVLNDFEKLFRATGLTVDDCIGYTFKGSVMNRVYKLSGDNAYSADLTFLVVPNYYNPMVKLDLGARWFDDIVSNNTIRQHGIDYSSDPDYGFEIIEDEDEE